ncbi:MAG: hypothetical protein LPK02_07215 [Rhodobacterales bacterium]|nr:hypothetical protein [Rhodobacterales bacterium]
MKLKSLITGAIMALSATTAQADAWDLERNGYWTTFLSDLENNRYGSRQCGIRNSGPDGIFFITVTDVGWYQMFFLLKDASLPQGGRLEDMVFKISLDGNGRGVSWTLSNGSATDAGNGLVFGEFNFGYHPHQRDFIRDFMRQDFVTVYARNGSPLARWSLMGSSRAIVSMDECHQRIMPNH